MNLAPFHLPEVYVGHAVISSGRSGVTAVLFPRGAVAGGDIRGGAPGTRETALLDPVNTVSEIHAVVVTGGSAFGLSAADGVMEVLAERGIGYHLAGHVVPIVVGAVLFDLPWLQPGLWPDRMVGREAAERAFSTQDYPSEGSVGAGAGASVAKWLGFDRAIKGGLGMARASAGAVSVAALVAVNALGDIVGFDGKTVAGPRGDQGMVSARDYLREGPKISEGSSTTIAVVVTNARLTKSQCRRVAIMAHDGMSRAINPVHTEYDGDTVVVGSVGTVEAQSTMVGCLAADAVQKAIIRAVSLAQGWAELPDLAQISRG